MNLSRRHFFLGSLALPAFAAKKAAGETPNIVLILVDNFPAWMLGCYGNKEVRTPAIDRLAQTGTRFLNHIASSPMPGPARDALLTAGGASLDKLHQAAGYTCQTTTGGAAAA